MQAFGDNPLGLQRTEKEAQARGIPALGCLHGAVMFGLSKREQRWKAEDNAARLLIGFASTAIDAGKEIRVAEAKFGAAEITRLRAENVELRRLLCRYRNETPLVNQPHMIADEVDAALVVK